MGLDCYFCSQEPVSFPENSLLGQPNFFYGRRYAPFVAALSGYDLYEERLDTSAVQQIATVLRDKLADYQGWSAPELLVWRSSEGRYCDITLCDLTALLS